MTTETLTDVISKRSRYSDPEFQRIYEKALEIFEQCCSEDTFQSESGGDCAKCPVVSRCAKFHEKVISVLDRRNPHHNPTEIMQKIDDIHTMKHGRYQLRLKGV